MKITELDAGFTLMKVKLGFGVEDEIACMQAIGKGLIPACVQCDKRVLRH